MSPPLSPAGFSPALSTLSLDTRCGNRSNWCCRLTAGSEADRLERRLAQRGYRVRCRHAALRVLRHPAGHEVSWALASGRVQIRTDLGLAVELREAAAQEVWRDLEQCLKALAAHRGEGAR